MLYRNQDQKLAYVTPTTPQQQVRFTLSNGPQAHSQNLYTSVRAPSFAPPMVRSVVGYYQQPGLANSTQVVKSKPHPQVCQVSSNVNKEIDGSEKNTEVQPHEDGQKNLDGGSKKQHWFVKHLWVILACLVVVGGVAACAIFLNKGGDTKNLTSQEPTPQDIKNVNDGVSESDENQTNNPKVVEETIKIENKNPQIKPQKTPKFPIDIIENPLLPSKNTKIPENKSDVSSSTLKEQNSNKINSTKIQSQITQPFIGIKDIIKKDAEKLQKQIVNGSPQANTKVLNATDKKTNVSKVDQPVVEPVQSAPLKENSTIAKQPLNLQGEKGVTVTFIDPVSLNKTQEPKTVHSNKSEAISQNQAKTQMNLTKVTLPTSTSAPANNVLVTPITNMTTKGNVNSTSVSTNTTTTNHTNPGLKTTTSNSTVLPATSSVHSNSTQPVGNSPTQTPLSPKEPSVQVQIDKMEEGNTEKFMQITKLTADI